MITGNAPLWLILLAFVAALGPLVFFHELGHYWVARWFGIGAEVFSIGFGREIHGWTDKRGTRWKIGWLPLGGYVKFIGDMGPASDRARPTRSRRSSAPKRSSFARCGSASWSSWPARWPISFSQS